MLLDQSHLGTVATVVALADQIPAELLAHAGESFAGFIAAMSALRAAVEAWQTGSRYRISTLPGFGDVHVLSLIPRGLASCPDKVPRPSTSDLAFIDDQPLRDTLRLDLSAVNRALATDEWKAATVLAGSVVEALLLWVLRHHPAGPLEAKVQELKAAKRLKRHPGS